MYNVFRLLEVVLFGGFVWTMSRAKACVLETSRVRVRLGLGLVSPGKCSANPKVIYLSFFLFFTSLFGDAKDLSGTTAKAYRGRSNHSR